MIFSILATTAVAVPISSIFLAADPEEIREYILNRLLDENDSRGCSFSVPMRVRYRLFDAAGDEIYSSPAEIVGHPLPVVPDDLPEDPGLTRQILYVNARGWILGINRSKLVPDHLRHLAVRADIICRPAVGEIRREKLYRSIKLTPSQLPAITTPPSLALSQKNSNFAPDMSKPVITDKFLADVDATITRHSLLRQGDKVVVALSGGADSVALLAALVDLGYDCNGAHCNFNLRGEESKRDMRHAEQVCRKLGVDFTAREFDVEAHRRKTGESLEMACRSLRYVWFDQLLTRESARAVAVAHHREDNVETVLLNLCRTTGIDGLRGIRYRRDYVIRPLLDCSRAEIEAYLARRGLDFVIDSSNSSDAHLRNRMRNHVIPELLRHFPDAESSILTSMANLDAAARIYHRAIVGYRDRFVSDSGAVDLAALKAELGPDAVTVLRELIKNSGATPSQCVDMVNSADRSGLKFPTSAGALIELDRGILSITRQNGPTGPTRPNDPIPINLNRDILTPIYLRISRHHISEFAPERNPSAIYLDSSALDPAHRWELRHWRQNDRINPFGLRGSRLVSDLFSDAKYSAAQKRSAWLLTCDDQIVWVVGLRASDQFNVGPHTRQFLKILYNP